MIIKKAFTFIEIIVTITIISLISISGTFYFHDFIWKQELVIYMDKFNSTYKELNNEVKIQKIFDYTLNIQRHSYWYTVSKNNIWVQNIQVAIFDTQNNSWSISLKPVVNNIWEIKFYKGIKKIEQITKNGLDIVTFNVDDFSTIQSSLSWSTLNTLSFYYLNNLDPWEKDVYILDIIDSNNISQNSLTIENINWKKTFYNNLTPLNSPIYILFEKNWIEDRLILN